MPWITCLAMGGQPSAVPVEERWRPGRVQDVAVGWIRTVQGVQPAPMKPEPGKTRGKEQESAGGGC